MLLGELFEVEIEDRLGFFGLVKQRVWAVLLHETVGIVPSGQRNDASFRPEPFFREARLGRVVPKSTARPRMAAVEPAASPSNSSTTWRA